MKTIIEKTKIAIDVLRLCLMIADHYGAKYWPVIIGTAVCVCEILSVYTSAKATGVSMFSPALFIVLVVIALVTIHFTKKHLKTRGSSK